MGRLDEWRFCPRCAEPIEVEGSHATCANCGFEAYGNSSPATDALVVRDGRVLLARRGIEPHKGKWDLPGGFLEAAEHPLDGVRRELREETGLEIEVHRFLRAGIERYGSQDVLILSWLASAPAGEPEPTDDVAELAWLAPDELPAPDEFAFAHHARLLADWRAGTLAPKDEPNGP